MKRRYAIQFNVEPPDAEDRDHSHLRPLRADDGRVRPNPENPEPGAGSRRTDERQCASAAADHNEPHPNHSIGHDPTEPRWSPRNQSAGRRFGHKPEGYTFEMTAPIGARLAVPAGGPYEALDGLADWQPCQGKSPTLTTCYRT